MQLPPLLYLVAHIVGVRAKRQVSRVTASPIITSVHYTQPRRYVTVCQIVGNAVCAGVALERVHADAAHAAPPLPFPAFIGRANGNLRPKEIDLLLVG